MAITVQLFGPQASLASARQLEIETAGEAASVEEIVEGIRVAAPELADSLATSRLAVNHEFATENAAVRPEDEVALIGMVSGG